MKFHSKYATILFALIFIILLFHLLNIGNLNVDNSSIILIIFLIILPFIPNIRKFKLGNLFEAELSEDIEKTITKKSPYEIQKGVELLDKQRSKYLIYFNLLEEDPVLSLANLRIDLERKLNTLLQMNKNKITIFSSKRGLRGTNDELFNNKIIDYDIFSGINDIIPLANRAVHGETVKEGDARQLVEYGLVILEQLDNQINSMSSE